MKESERYAQYLICKQRGHATEKQSLLFARESEKQKCKFCNVNFWHEWCQIEDNVPTKPEET